MTGNVMMGILRMVVSGLMDMGLHLVVEPMDMLVRMWPAMAMELSSLMGINICRSIVFIMKVLIGRIVFIHISVYCYKGMLPFFLGTLLPQLSASALSLHLHILVRSFLSVKKSAI